MVEMEETYLYERFTKEFCDLENHPGVVLQLGAIQAWSLLSTIQLACRHPEFVGPTREMSEAIARQLEEGIAVTPALAIVARRGWDSRFDE